MVETLESVVTAAAPNRVGVLARDFQARILNYSQTGCLLETSSPIEVGTIGSMRFVIDGSELADDVQVVRCQAIEGAGSFRVGVRFLWTVLPGKDSLRYAFTYPAPGSTFDSKTGRSEGSQIHD